MTQPNRIGKKNLSVTLTHEKWRKLRNIVTDTERPATDLIDEAIDMLAEKYPTTPTRGAKRARRATPER
jgi:Ribbon-helix-helix domain